MARLFYQQELLRIKQKNYLYLNITLFTWVLFVIQLSIIQNYSRAYSFYYYEIYYLLGIVYLLSKLYENLFYVREQGIYNKRITKYATTPLLQKDIFFACYAIMARYHLRLTAGCLILYLCKVILIKESPTLSSWIVELAVLLGTGCMVYLGFVIHSLINKKPGINI